MNANTGSGNATDAFNSKEKIIKGGNSLWNNNNEINKISKEEVIKIQKNDVNKHNPQIEQITRDMAKNMASKYVNA